jgi:hypothetical protein
MRRLAATAMLFGTILVSSLAPGEGGVPVYIPLKEWKEGLNPVESGRSVPRHMSIRPLRTDARPQLIGVRRRSTEILEDGLLRKHSRLLRNSPSLARELIVRRFARNRPQLYGIMAEAVFVDRNPEWGYVRHPNASQHDVYRWVPGRQTPQTGQIKFHANGLPSTYARDMLSDHRSDQFFIPDDHVPGTKAYLRELAEKYAAVGDSSRVAQAWRNHNRIHPLGATSREIAVQTRSARTGVVLEKRAVYTPLGVALALSWGPTAWDLANGDLSGNSALYRATQSVSLIGVGLGTELFMTLVSEGALRGTIRGNAIVGSAVMIAEMSWLLYEHGGMRAFYRPEFYEQFIGGVSGLSLGLIATGYTALLTSELGPLPATVSGMVAGTAVGTAGYVGGRAAVRIICEIVWPDLLQQQEKQTLEAIRLFIAEKFRDARRWSAE